MSHITQQYDSYRKVKQAILPSNIGYIGQQNSLYHAAADLQIRCSLNLYY